MRVRLNLFTATTKAIGWRSNKHSRKTRVYDTPRTRYPVPGNRYQRFTYSGIMTVEKAAECATLFGVTNPADLTRKITSTQIRLITLAKDKTSTVTVSVSRAV